MSYWTALSRKAPNAMTFDELREEVTRLRHLEDGMKKGPTLGERIIDFCNGRKPSLILVSEADYESLWYEFGPLHCPEPFRRGARIKMFGAPIYPTSHLQKGDFVVPQDAR